MAALRRWLKRIGLLALALLAAAGLYAGVALALMAWPANPASTAGQAPQAQAQAQRITAWVISNGVHTDLVLPLHAAGVDWRATFPAADAPAPAADAQWIAFGWGDREFYLNTPTWADLTPGRALGAVLGRNPALLHVSWLTTAQLRPGHTWRLSLTPGQYQELARHVRDTLPAGRAVRIPGAHYGPDDAFYEATGHYHLFETCNTWVGRGLRRAGVTVSRWTPFDINVVWHLPPWRPSGHPMATPAG